MRISPKQRADKVSYMTKKDRLQICGTQEYSPPFPTYGAGMVRNWKTQEITVSTSGLATTTTGFFPAGSRLVALWGRVTEAIATANRTGIDVGDGTVQAQFASMAFTSNALAKGTTFDQFTDGTAATSQKVFKTAADLVFTVTGGSSLFPTTGKIRVTAIYDTITKPTS